MSNLEAGSVIGERYEILSLIKAGGMGAVYQARDVRGGPVVALKEMLQSFSFEVDRQLIYKKFEEEARLLQTLNHPSIPRVQAHFARGDVYYIVMEYIEGESLEQLLDDYLTLTRRPMPPQLVVECALLLCPILTYLHTRQPRPIIHRDLKPGNIILRQNRTEVALVDFGLARDISATNTQSPKTMVGTLGYAPLEQLRGQPEIRSDLYALGVTMHHMLSGRVPKLFELAPLQGVMPDLPAELVALVERATQEDPGKRFQSAAEMEQSLAQILATWKPMPRLSMARSLVNPGRPTGHIPKPRSQTSRIMSPKELPRSDTGRVPPDGRFATQDDSVPEAGHGLPSLPPVPSPSVQSVPPPVALTAPRPANGGVWRLLLPVGAAVVFAGGLWAGLLWGRHDDPSVNSSGGPVASTSALAPVSHTPVAIGSVPPSSPEATASSPTLRADDATAPLTLLAPDLRKPLHWKWEDQDGVELTASGTFLQADLYKLGRVVFIPAPLQVGPVKTLSFVLKAGSGSAPFLVWVGNYGVLVDLAAPESSNPILVLKLPEADIPKNRSIDDLKKLALNLAGNTTTGLRDPVDLRFALQATPQGLALQVDRASPPDSTESATAAEPTTSASPSASAASSWSPMGSVEASSAPSVTGVTSAPSGSAGESVTASAAPVLYQQAETATPWSPGEMGCRVLGMASKRVHLTDLFTDPH